MKLIVTTDTDRTIATFTHAERLDYIDYSAELDDAIRAAIRADHGILPRWLKSPRR